MAKPDGFLEWKRQTAARRPVAERLGDWEELYQERDPAARREQAGRCMDCGVPFCHQGCPLGNPIPDFNEAVFRDDWERAWRYLSSTNNFPEFTGRLCPAPCEASCVLAINDDPVTIEQIEKEIAERAWAEGWERPRPPRQETGRHVAVVGSGPAGMAAAQQLRRAGHAVTLYDKADQLGGLLRYGIPDFKLAKTVVDRRLEQLQAEGVVFRPGVDVGVDPTWTELHDGHDALVVAIGALRPRDLPVPGRELDGVHFAMDFLEAGNRAVAGTALPEAMDAKGRDVLVLGGGDTGSDCVGTALRQGARSVRQVELLPAPPEARAEGNPWPQWPMVFRTSHAHEEGAERDWSWRTTHLEGADGRVARLHATHEGTGEATVFDTDLVLLAMGFVGPSTHTLARQLKVALTPRGNVAATGYRTTVPGVYVAGDAHRGASLIVWAIAEGREAARVIDADLMGAERLAARGQHLPFR